MSKAFTKESDDGPEESLAPLRQSPLPPGAKNYMTQAGERRLRGELERLVTVARPAALPSSTSPTSGANAVSNVELLAGQGRLREIDRRIHLLRESLESAEVIDPSKQDSDRVRFGATVTVCEEGGSEHAYRIVGVDETDVERGFVSWLSPIAKALLNSRVGDVVKFRSPEG